MDLWGKEAKDEGEHYKRPKRLDLAQVSWSCFLSTNGVKVLYPGQTLEGGVPPLPIVEAIIRMMQPGRVEQCATYLSNTKTTTLCQYCRSSCSAGVCNFRIRVILRSKVR